MKYILFSFLLLTNLFMQSGRASTSDQKDGREFKMAEQAILISLISAKSSDGRKACLENSLACSDDRADLGLILIKEKISPAALSHLIKVMRYPIDGGLSEDYVCYVAEKGHAVVNILRKINEEELHSQCIQETKKLINENFKDVMPDLFCTSEDNMRKRKKELLEMISKGVKCDPSDY